jgi:hypothetical protein
MSCPSKLGVGIGFIAASMLLVVAAANAAEKDELPPQTPSRQTVPEAPSPGSGGSAEPLSEKLDRQHGVIRPPAGIDPGMTQTPPAVGKMPVIPPPGTPGGEQGVQPK